MVLPEDRMNLCKHCRWSQLFFPQNTKLYPKESLYCTHAEIKDWCVNACTRWEREPGSDDIAEPRAQA